ncbi:hypothetical protein FOA52_007773 [Chlamydomonas sp. UWO 241]|nr:hypothetical protein FOA52_007773 [Chlamydomonas sp. UWO 241]
MTRSKRKHSKAAGALVARAATATESPVSSGSSDSDLRPRNRACVDETQITLLALPGALGAATYAEAVQHLHGGASNHISASADTTDAIRALSAAVDDLRGLVQAQQIASLVDLVRLLLMSRVPGAPMHTPHAVPHAAHSAPRAAPAAKAAQPARPAAAAAPVASAAGAPAAERPAAAGAARAASARGPCRRGGLPARVGDASLRLSFVASISVENAIVFVTGGDGCGHANDVFSGCFAEDAEEARRRAADAAAGVSMPVRLATNIVRFMHDNTGNWDGPAGGGVVSASFINAKPAVGGIGVEPRGGGVLRVLFTVASGAVADTVVRWRWKLRQTQVAVFDVLSDREEARHRALWPAFLAAKAAGKRAQCHRAHLVVDGERTGINVYNGSRYITRIVAGIEIPPETVVYDSIEVELAPVDYDTPATDANTHRYLWLCAFTANEDAQAYFYRSNPLFYANTQNAGLYGMIAVEKKVAGFEWTNDARGMPLKPASVDREIVIVIHVQLEDASFCGDINCYTVSPFRYGSKDFRFNRNRADAPTEQQIPSDPDTGGSWAPNCNTILDPEPFTHHVINGLFYCNLPDINLYKDQKVRWFVSVIGDQGDTHPLHLHGNTVVSRGVRSDNFNLAPGAVQTLNMLTDNAPGNWLAHCHISDHIGAGMIFWYNVLPTPGKEDEAFFPPYGRYVQAEISTDGVTPGLTADASVLLESDASANGGLRDGGKLREYWVKAHAVLVNYTAPTPHNNDYRWINPNGTYKLNPDDASDLGPDGYDPYHGTCNVNPEIQPCLLVLPGNAVPDGCQFWKMLFVEYVIPDTCTETGEMRWACAIPKPRHVDEFHRGLLGPVLKAEVGDKLRVHFQNDPFPQCKPGTAVCSSTNDTLHLDTCDLTCNVGVGRSRIAVADFAAADAFPVRCDPSGDPAVDQFCGDQWLVGFAPEYSSLAFSMHPHGVWYTKNNEGAPYYDMTAQKYAYVNNTDMGGPKTGPNVKKGLVGEEVWEPLNLLGFQDFDLVPNYFPVYDGLAADGVTPKQFQLGPGSVYPRQKDDFVPSAFMCVQDVMGESIYGYYKYFTFDGRSIRDLCVNTLVNAGVGGDLGNGYVHTEATFKCVQDYGCDTYAYEWFVEERSGPAEAEGACVLWAGHSHSDEITDVYAGLFFNILSCQRDVLVEDTYASPGTRATQVPALQPLYDHNLSYTRLIVSPSVADQETFMTWQDTQEQGSALCSFNNFLQLPSYLKTCDNTFIVDFPTINGLVYCLPELHVDWGKRVMMGFLGFGSEPDYNSIGFDDLPLKSMAGRLELNNFVLLPGVSTLKRLETRMVPLQDDMQTNFKFSAGLSDFANRGMQAYLSIAPSAAYADHMPSFDLEMATEDERMARWSPITTAVSDKFYYIEARVKVHDFWENIARDAAGNPLDCDGNIIDVGIVGDNSEGETIIGTTHVMTWFTNGWELDFKSQVDATTRSLINYGIVGPSLIAYADRAFQVTYCNKDVPFRVTLKVGCGIELTHVVGTTGLALPNGTRPGNAANDPFLSTGQCARFSFYVPAYLDPQTALSGTMKTSLPCMYYSEPEETTGVYTPTGVDTDRPPPSNWDKDSAPGPALHTTSGLVGLVIVRTSITDILVGQGISPPENIALKKPAGMDTSSFNGAEYAVDGNPGSRCAISGNADGRRHFFWVDLGATYSGNVTLRITSVANANAASAADILNNIVISYAETSPADVVPAPGQLVTETPGLDAVEVVSDLDDPYSLAYPAANYTSGRTTRTYADVPIAGRYLILQRIDGVRLRVCEFVVEAVVVTPPSVDAARDPDVLDIPLMFKVHDMNRVHPNLIAATKELHCAGKTDCERPLGGPPLLGWKANMVNGKVFTPPEPYQYLFDPTPDMYYKNVDCQVQNEGADCMFANCQPACTSSLPLPTDPMALPGTCPTDNAASCPICNYNTNFEMEDGCDPFQYLYTNYKFAINGYGFCSGGSWLPKIQAGKVYRFHLFTPPGDYYFYFQDLQSHDVYNVQFRGLKVPEKLYEENVTLFTSITNNVNTVLWPVTSNEVDISFRSTGLDYYESRCVLFDENQLNTEQGMEAVLEVSVWPTKCWETNPLYTAGSTIIKQYNEFKCPPGWRNSAGPGFAYELPDATYPDGRQPACASAADPSCTISDCCYRPGICVDFVATGDVTQLNASSLSDPVTFCTVDEFAVPQSTVCAGPSCVRADCCLPVCPSDSTALCAAGDNLVPNPDRNGTYVCPEGGCTASDCCVQTSAAIGAAALAAFNTARVTWLLNGGSVIRCAAIQCTAPEVAYATCSATFPCGDYMASDGVALVRRAAPGGAAVLCPDNVCTVQACCKDIRPCVGATAGTYKAAGTVCRDALVARPDVGGASEINGLCDMNFCTGNSPLCPPIGTVQPPGTVCRKSAGVCDMPEVCTGASVACPRDVNGMAGQVCREAVPPIPGADQTCDLPEKCTNASPDCPADSYKPSNRNCRRKVDKCDIADSCSGTSPYCPLPDVVEPTTKKCGGSAKNPIMCDGVSGFCPVAVV